MNRNDSNEFRDDFRDEFQSKSFESNSRVENPNHMEIERFCLLTNCLDNINENRSKSNQDSIENMNNSMKEISNNYFQNRQIDKV